MNSISLSHLHGPRPRGAIRFARPCRLLLDPWQHPSILDVHTSSKVSPRSSSTRVEWPSGLSAQTPTNNAAVLIKVTPSLTPKNTRPQVIVPFRRCQLQEGTTLGPSPLRVNLCPARHKSSSTSAHARISNNEWIDIRGFLVGETHGGGGKHTSVCSLYCRW